MSRSYRTGAAPPGALASSSLPLSPSASSAYRPLSPKELGRAAEMFEWRPQIPLKFHIGSLDAMYREGKTYLAEHNYAKAYVLLLRFSIICVEKVPTHPDANTPDGRRLVRTVTRRLKTVLSLLESIKELLAEARRRWTEDHGGDYGDYTDSKNDDDVMPDSRPSDVATFAALDPALSWNPHAQAQLLDAAEHVDLAIELANKRQQGSRSSATVSSSVETNDVSREMERARWRLDEMAQRPNYDNVVDGEGDDRPGPVPVAYNYPSVHRSTPVSYESMRFDQQQQQQSIGSTRTDTSDGKSAVRPPRPPLPPKRPTYEFLSSRRDDNTPSARPPPVPSRGEPLASRYNDDLFLLQQPSELPSSPIITTSTPPPPPPKTRDVAEPIVPPPPPTKSQYTFKPAAYLESGAPIRSVFLPDTLRHDFLRLAQPNTTKGIETCGILCGKTANNALFITCLLIPQQVGTRDSCETTGEVATLEYCSEADVIQIGWIHTHPTQTCFMSSLDMHTHAGYQIMMDESVAIVCAPKFEPSWGIFRLTNPPGLPYIGGCRKAGAFHEHDLRPHEIYTEAKNPPGHVFVVPGIDYTVADLRDIEE